MRMEDVIVGFQAKCLVKEPLTARHVFFPLRAAEFVPQTGEALFRFVFQGKTKLNRFRVSDVEKGDGMAQHLGGFAVFHRNEVDAAADMAQLLRPEQQVGHFVDFVNHRPGRVDAHLPFIIIQFHSVTDSPHHPDDAHKMVHMLVGDEDVVNIPPVQEGLFQLPENLISAAAVHQEEAAVFLQGEAGIVILCGQRKAGPQYVHFHKLNPFVCHRRTPLPSGLFFYGIFYHRKRDCENRNPFSMLSIPQDVNVPAT